MTAPPACFRIETVDHTGDTISRTVGDNLIEYLGIHRWEPPMVRSGQVQELSPTLCPPIDGAATKFDLENINNFPDVIRPGESVIITEKIHGANARFLFLDGVFYVGSRTRWLKRPEEGALDMWHRVVEKTPGIEAFCREFEGVILYGEVFGNVQDLKYGRPNAVDFAGFAAYDCKSGKWWKTLTLLYSLPDFDVMAVPVLATGGFDPETMKALAEADSSVPGVGKNHMREGVVVTPMAERRDPNIGRVSLKYVSNRYWERKL